MKQTLTCFFNFCWFSPANLTLLCCLAFSNTVFAQTDTVRKLNEVPVSSAAAPRVQSVTPSQSISADEFNRYNAVNVADAIRHFAGVIVKDYGGIGGLKTISVRGLGANHTAVLYDGVQINDAENGQVDLSKFNLNGIQAITLYNGQPPHILQTARAFASASVLDIQTVKPRLNAVKPYQLTAGIKVGSFGEVNPYLQWQQRLSSKWSAVINSYTENADGRYKYLINNGATTSGQTRIGSDIAAQQIDGSLYWNNTDSSKFSLHVNYYNSDRGLPGPVILYLPPPAGQRIWNQDLFVQAGYEHGWQSGLHLLLNSKFSHGYLHYFDPKFPSASGVLDQHYTQREFYQSAALSYTVLPNWEVSYAMDIAVNNMDADMANFRHPNRLTLLNVLASNLVLGNLTLQASLLNTHVSETVSKGTTVPNRNIYSPTVMATIKPLNDKNFELRAFYKSIFRYPTFQDLYYGFVPNTTLKPEYTHQYDLGLTYSKNLNSLLEYATFTADAYYNRVTDKIVFIPSLYNGSTQNFGDVDIKGLDVCFKTRAKLGVSYKASLSATYSYQRALNVTGPATSTTYLNQLPYIPENTGTVNAGISRGGVGIYYNQVLSSSRYYNNNNNADDYLPPYSISDASMIYTGAVSHAKIVVSAEVNNLFNKSYVVIQSFPMPGRSFRFSFQITI